MMTENRHVEWGAFVLRVIFGLTFFIHGWSKFSGGIDGVSGWFASIGLPGFLAYIVAMIELVGGILLIIGLGTRLIALLNAFVMIGAIFSVKLSAGFMGNGQSAGYEFDLALLAIAIYLVLNGSRFLAVDSMFSNKKR
ncbi:putative membrane protein YphA (DoxX/SURF4 family) [Baia soyae]|uniref:Putative membrane protein YphA (DoxX/SURF4 family) n=2 Tax=Baia soyae TaxID=1544746 RepID=A0A4R2SGI4_9BACL|nr:putative membrane protein YphA (DoxX/SURF4 family) [Baia soyae]